MLNDRDIARPDWTKTIQDKKDIIFFGITEGNTAHPEKRQNQIFHNKRTWMVGK